MGTGLQVWSDTASSNAGSDQNINWAEGMAPSQVNDSARAEMASAAKWRDDNNATIATSGSTIAYTVTSNQISTGLVNGYTIAVQFHATNDSSATLNVDGIGPEPMQLVSGTNLSGGEFKTGSHQRFTYSSTAAAWIAFCSQAQSNITYSQIQTVTNSRLLGNASTSASTAGGPLAEISVGSGLTFLSSGVLDGPTFYNPAIPSSHQRIRGHLYNEPKRGQYVAALSACPHGWRRCWWRGRCYKCRFLWCRYQLCELGSGGRQQGSGRLSGKCRQRRHWRKQWHRHADFQIKGRQWL